MILHLNERARIKFIKSGSASQIPQNKFKFEYVKIIFFVSSRFHFFLRSSLKNECFDFGDWICSSSDARAAHKLCAFNFNYLWKRSERKINNVSQDDALGGRKGNRRLNRYGLILSSKVICAFCYSKQRRSVMRSSVKGPSLKSISRAWILLYVASKRPRQVYSASS